MCTNSSFCENNKSGLDNAGKTTIVKKIMNEDVNSVSPTLGFIIKTIDYEGLDKDLLCSYYFLHALLNVITTQISSLLTTMNKARYKLNICKLSFSSRS